MNKDIYTLTIGSEEIGLNSFGTPNNDIVSLFTELLTLRTKNYSFDTIKEVLKDVEDFYNSIPVYPKGQLS